MALADGYIGVFEAKYHYKLLAAVTAIRAADTDGNPDTDRRPGLDAARADAADPDHDSGHAVEGGAAATVLRAVLRHRPRRRSRLQHDAAGREQLRRRDAGVRATTRSFSQAAEENGVSRILVGFHFRQAVDDGIAHGRRIGDRAVDRFMRPRR